MKELTIDEQIEKVKESLFLLDMVDRWTSDDYKLHDELRKHLLELQALKEKQKVGDEV
jgi:hypothetical protein